MSKGTLLIEWGEQFPQALPLSFLQIEFVITGPNSRRLEISAQGARGKQLQKELSLIHIFRVYERMRS